MTETYQHAVQEARTLAKRSEEDQWRLAQLTWEQASPHEDDKKTLTQWAQDIGVHPSYVGRLYKMWDSYQSASHLDRVERPKFSEAYNETRPGTTYQPPLHNQPVADQAKAVQEALSNPEVASKVFSDPGTKAKAITAIHHHNDQPSHEPSAPQPPAPTRLDILNELAEARRRVRQAFKHAVAFNPDDDAKNDILSELTDVKAEIEPFEAFLVGMGLDEAIAQMLQGA
jgi:hypothetical protein